MAGTTSNSLCISFNLSCPQRIMIPEYLLIGLIFIDPPISSITKKPISPITNNNSVNSVTVGEKKIPISITRRTVAKILTPWSNASTLSGSDLSQLQCSGHCSKYAAHWPLAYHYLLHTRPTLFDLSGFSHRSIIYWTCIPLSDYWSVIGPRQSPYLKTQRG